MTDDRMQTMVTVRDGTGEREIGFQDYFVRRAHNVPVTSLRFDGAERRGRRPVYARPSPRPAWW